MLKNRDKITIVFAVIFFFATQTVILASLPAGTDSTPVVVIIKSGTSLGGIARQLKNGGLIQSPLLFQACSLLFRGRLIAGEYQLSKKLSAFEIVKKMGRGERNIYILKIIEGYNLNNIANAMEESRIMSKKEFLDLAKNQEFLDRIGIPADSLEGYLAPDTYYYSKETDIDKFIERIIRRTFKNFQKEDIKQRMSELNFDMYKTLTLASMIEKETQSKTEKPLVSAVFHNRLKKGMSLDCDPTVIYGRGTFDVPIKKSDLATRTPYNTYTFTGLPKGPIANPDPSSIRAALYPAPVDYLYFVSRNDGTHVFSKDMREHNRYVNMYQRAKTTKKQ